MTKSLHVKRLNETDAEDWFTVSGVKAEMEGEVVSSFELLGDSFQIKKASEHKCPRCWKYKADVEEGLCPRCEKVINA